MWILSKLRFLKCDSWQKWDFENVNFAKNKTLKLWILWKIRLWNCEFCEKWDFEIVNFVKNEILKMWILAKIIFSKYDFWIWYGFYPREPTSFLHATKEMKLRFFDREKIVAILEIDKLGIGGTFWKVHATF